MNEINYNVPVGAPEPLVTELVIKQYKNNLEGTYVFEYPEIDEGFLKKVKDIDSSRTMTGIEAAALADTHTKQVSRVLTD